MRIGYDAKRYFHNRTGLGNYSRDLIRILAAHYPENEYLLYTPKKGMAEVPAQASVRLPSGIWNGLLGSLWRRIRIARAARRDRVDLYHGLSNELPAGLTRVSISTVVTIHDLIFERFPKLYAPIDRRMYRFKFRRAAQQADVVVAISQQTKDDLIHYYNIREDKIRVIYQGCAPVFQSEIDQEQVERVRQRYNLNHPFILQVGTIEERKNAGLCIEALPMIDDLEFILVGRPTKYWDQIRETAVSLGVSDRIRRVEPGDMTELACIYRMATVFVYPSRFEGFGIPIIEALYSETPVVTSSNGVFSEAAGPGSAYINPDDAQQLAVVVNRIAGSPEVRRRMTEAGLKHARNFNDETIAGQWHQLYQSLNT